jgi:tetratricopeptide (TPR) repeat protein
MTGVLWVVVAGLMGAQSPHPPPALDEDTSRLLSQAQAALDRADLEAAGSLFEKARARAPDHPAPLLGLCRVHELLAQYLDAAKTCRAAQELAPVDPAVALQLARVLAGMGAGSEALDVLADVRRLEPQAPEAYLLSVLLLRDAGRRQEAVSLLEEARDRGVDSPKIGEELALLRLSLNDVDGAADIARQTLSEYPESPSLKVALGLALARTPRGRSEAIRLLRDGLAHGMEHEAVVRLELGNALLESGDAQQAVEQFRMAVAAEPDSAEAHYRLGTALKAAGDMNTAADELARFQELRRKQDQSDLEAKNFKTELNEAQNLALANRLHESLARLDALVKSGREDDRAYALRAKVLVSLGRDEEALADIQRARELAPQSAEYHYLEGRFLFQLGRVEPSAGDVSHRRRQIRPGLRAPRCHRRRRGTEPAGGGKVGTSPTTGARDRKPSSQSGGSLACLGPGR